MGRKTPPAAKPAEEPSAGLDELGIVDGTQVKRERVAWDWPKMIVRNAVNIIDGHKGTGKSSLLATVAAALCNGKKLPESKVAGPKGACLWFGTEESFGCSVVPRWVANSGRAEDIRMVATTGNPGGGSVVLPYQEDRLREIVQRTRARVVVVDPYTSLGDVSLDSRNEQSTRMYLEAMSRIAHEEHVTFLLSRHLRKGRSGSLLEHGLGSIAIGAVCRSVLRVERDQENPSVCFLACVCTNFGRAEGVIPYTLTEAPGDVFVCAFGKRKDKELSEVLEGGDEPDERDTLADARSLLKLALKAGPVDAKVLLEEAKKNGIGERTLRKAKADMSVTSKRIAAGKGVPANWQWQLAAG